MGIIKQIVSIALPLSLAMVISACNSPIIAEQTGTPEKEYLIPGNYSVDLGGKTGKSITIKINDSQNTFGIKSLLPVSPALVKNITGYNITLCTDPSKPFLSAVATPFMISRDGSSLNIPHTITFNNVPVGGPYYAVASAIDLNGINITESDNGGPPYSGEPGAQAAVSGNTVTVNPDLSLTPAGVILLVNLNLLSSKPGTDDFSLSPPNLFQQDKPAVSTSLLGRGLLVWAENCNGNLDIMARKIWGFNPIDNDFKVNLNVIANVDPAVSLDSNGNGIVVWSSRDNGVNYKLYGIKIVDYAPAGAEFTIADVLTSEQQRPSVVLNGSGNGMVTWNDNRNGDFDIFAKKLVNGLPFGTDMRIDQAPSGNQYYPDISLNAAGNGIITWIDERSSSISIYSRKIVNFTTPVNEAGPLATNVYPHVSINLNQNGDGLITWSIAARVFADKITGLVPSGIPFQVSDATTSTKLHPEVLLDSTGKGLISWEDLREGGAIRIYSRKIITYSPAGTTDTRVTTSPDANLQQFPAIALNGGGNGFIAWSDTRNSLYSIQIRHIINLDPFQVP